MMCEVIVYQNYAKYKKEGTSILIKLHDCIFLCISTVFIVIGLYGTFMD